MKKTKAIIFILLLLVTFGLFGCSTQFKEDNNSDDDGVEETVVTSYVTMTINPSIGIIVDKENTVVAIHPLNEDGEILLLNIEFANQDLSVVLELILDESIELGFIDVEADQVVIEVTAAGNLENVREMVETRVNEVLAERNIPAQVRERVFNQEFLDKANDLNVAPQKYQLMQTVMMADAVLTAEEAKELDVEELIAKVRENISAVAEIAQSLKDQFLVARQEVLDQYLPLIKDLEAQIEAELEAEESVEALEVELAELNEQMEAALQEVVNNFVEETKSIRNVLQQKHQDLINQNKQRLEDFRDRINRP